MPRERANERSCDAAIKRTVTYRAIFKYQLSYHQLANFLVSNKTYKKEFFDKELAKMVKKGYIGYRNGKYYDKRIKPVSWELRYKQSQEAIAKAKAVSKILRHIPWIQMIAVTGSVAAYNADKDADIDFFIIADTHRLWLTRGFVSLILKISGMYAQYGQGPGKVCPNLYIDTEGMEWATEQRSVFTAHEIVLMQPLYSKNEIYFKFLQANGWIKDYFADFRIPLIANKVNSRNGNAIGNGLEKLAQSIQYKYMHAKITNEIIGQHILHFKKNDNTNWIIDKYKELISD